MNKKEYEIMVVKKKTTSIKMSVEAINLIENILKLNLQEQY